VDAASEVLSLGCCGPAFEAEIMSRASRRVAEAGSGVGAAAYALRDVLQRLDPARAALGPALALLRAAVPALMDPKGSTTAICAPIK
jgi:hypothetical protein